MFWLPSLLFIHEMEYIKVNGTNHSMLLTFGEVGHATTFIFEVFMHTVIVADNVGKVMICE